MKSFLDKLDRFSLTRKNENTAQTEFDRQLALVKQPPSSSSSGGEQGNNNGVVAEEIDSVDITAEFTDDNVADMVLAIQQAKHITTLRLRDKSIEPSIEFFASLCSTTTTLTELRLSNAGINDHESNCIVAALLNNKSIKTLAVDHNNITSVDPWAQLVKINKHLESLDLSHNRLCVVKGSDVSFMALAHSLVGNLRLKNLYLVGNAFQDSSMKLFLKIIEEHGDSMGIRSLDLMNDSSLPQSTRDALMQAMARPWSSGNTEVGLKNPRVADDPEGEIVESAASDGNNNNNEYSPTAAAAAASTIGLPGHQLKLQTPIRAAVVSGGSNNNNNDTNVSGNKYSPGEHGDEGEVIRNYHQSQSPPSTSTTQQNVKISSSSSQQQHQPSLEDDYSVSNISFSTDPIPEENTTNNSPQNLDSAALKAAKIAKLKEMKSRHLQELKRRDQIEKELRDQIGDLVQTVEQLTKEVATAKKAAAVAAASTAAVVSSSSSVAGSSSSSGGGGDGGENTKRLQEQIELLTSQHKEELREKEQKITMRQQENDIKTEELAALVTSLTSKFECSSLESKNFKEKLEQQRKEYEKKMESMKSSFEVQRNAQNRNFLNEKELSESKLKMMESKLQAAESRAESTLVANKNLNEDAKNQMEQLRNQLEAALSSASSGKFLNKLLVSTTSSSSGGNGDDSPEHHHHHVDVSAASASSFESTSAASVNNNFVVKVDKLVQTAPLPTIRQGGGSSFSSPLGGGGGGGPTMSGSLNFSSLSSSKQGRAATVGPNFGSNVNTKQQQSNNATDSPTQSVPSIDVSSVTRFKMPDSQLSRTGSDDSFNDNDSDEHRHSGGKLKMMPKSKWQKDEDAPNCTGCKVKFGLLTLRHHCRICGRVFCDDCAPVSKHDKVRQCHLCVSSMHSVAAFR